MGAGLADTEIGRRFDLVGFDPRGVGHSTPELRCRTDAEFDAFRREPNADYSQAVVAHIEALSRDFAQKCVDRVGPEFLANVGTASTAQDMDVVRAALGENQISYLGFSYGTEIGAAYALSKGVHIRADFIYRRWSVRTQGRMDTALFIICYFPTLLIFLWVSSEWAWTSVSRGERGTDTAFMPLLGPLKSALPLGIVFLLIQGVSELLKAIHAARKGEWPQ
jgi:TRAP-type mannitol/chloroaromatic compound transport system permease small subunit